MIRRNARKEAFNAALKHLNDHHKTLRPPGSSLHNKVWVISGMALCTAAYDIFCVFLVARLIGRDRFQDDPFAVQSTVMPGRMPVGSWGILLSITLIGAFLSQILVVPLADNFGRKFMFEVCLLIMFFASAFSAFSFFNTQDAASGPNVVGSLCGWRFALGIGVGGMYPLTAAIVAEYSPKYTRGSYLTLTFAAHGFGIFMACIMCLITCYGVNRQYPAGFFPLTMPSGGCATFTALDANGMIPCPLGNQQAYAQLIANAQPSQIQYIWRAVVSAGAFGALLTFILSRLFIVETPRFMAQVAGEYEKAIEDLAHQCEIDYRNQMVAAGEVGAGGEESKGEDDELPEQVPIMEFLGKHGINMGLACASWFLINMVFSGLLILIDDPAKVIGFNKGNYWQPAADECAGLAQAYMALCVSTLIPGYYIAVATIDHIGRKVAQFMGFAMTAMWCAACAGSYNTLLMPNNPKLMDGTNPVWRGQAIGWVVMFALTFFFAAWGPLSTSYILPAELFPSAWRATGYGLCAAAGSLGSIVGIWVFIYASQPFPRQVTYAYPCTRTDSPSDLYTFGSGACLRLPACPVGLQVPVGNNVGFPCAYCPSTKSGCYPYGVGTSGSLALMVPILAVGAVVTMLLPLTDNRSLEEISLDESEFEGFLAPAPPREIRRDEYMERGYEEAHPRGTNFDPALLAQRELERQRARAAMVAKERAKAALLGPGPMTAGALGSVADNYGNDSHDRDQRVTYEYNPYFGEKKTAEPPLPPPTPPPPKAAAGGSPPLKPSGAPPPLARPPPGMEVLTAVARINQLSSQKVNKDSPPLKDGTYASAPRQWSDAKDDGPSKFGLDDAPIARMPPGFDIEEYAPPPQFIAPTSNAPRAALAPVARMPPGDSYGFGFGFGSDYDDVPLPPLARMPPGGGFDNDDDDDVPEAAPPDFGGTVATAVLARPKPPTLPVPDATPPSSLFLPPARLPSRPQASLPSAAVHSGSGSGLQFGAGSTSKGPPKHMPPALAPRAGVSGGLSARPPSARGGGVGGGVGVSGVDQLGDDHGLAYDDTDVANPVHQRPIVPPSVLPPAPPPRPAVPVPPMVVMPPVPELDEFNFGGQDPPREPQLKKR